MFWTLNRHGFRFPIPWLDRASVGEYLGKKRFWKSSMFRFLFGVDGTGQKQAKIAGKRSL